MTKFKSILKYVVPILVVTLLLGFSAYGSNQGSETSQYAARQYNEALTREKVAEKVYKTAVQDRCKSEELLLIAKLYDFKQGKTSIATKEEERIKEKLASFSCPF
jgi:hypothetical protein